MKLLLVLAALTFVFPSGVFAKIERDPKQRAAFVRLHPCPATGKHRGACPGYVVDHVKPLCAGGRDRPSNMQWQAVAESRLKDKQEWKLCRDNRARRVPSKHP